MNSRPRPFRSRPCRSECQVTQNAGMRRGVTLTEVLMSLLVMGLGITSVFTLFPMSILRSVKATNTTNATLLSQSARDFYLSNRETLNIAPRRNGVTVTIGIDTYQQDPLLRGIDVATGGVFTPIPDTLIPEPFVGTYVVDPYGGNQARFSNATLGKFGENLSTGQWGVLRVAGYQLGRSANAISHDEVASQDSWVTDFEAMPDLVSPSPQGHVLTFSTASNFNDLSNNKSRLLISSSDGRRTSTRYLHNTDPVPTANQLQTSRPLPSGMDQSNEIGLVRLQNLERRYTWLLTLHYAAPNSVPTGQIVVFFRRSFGESEWMYNATPVANRQGRVMRVSGYTEGTPKAGDYVFGSWVIPRGVSNPAEHHGRWFRLVRVDKQGTDYDLTLDRTWVAPPGSQQPMLMFPKGVVGVYDLY